MFEQMELIAHDDVLQAGIALDKAVGNIWRAAVTDGDLPVELFADWVKTTTEFTAAARKSLGHRSIIVEFSDGDDEPKSSKQ